MIQPSAPNEEINIWNEFDETSGRVSFAVPEYTISYEFERRRNKVRIFANAPYLEKIKDGRVVAGVRFWWSPFQWQFPKLSIKMVNDTSRRVLITHAEVNVKTSQIDTNPVLIIEENPYKVGYFSMLNEGWGPVLDPKLDLNIAPLQAYGFFPKDGPWCRLQVADFVEGADINIDGLVPLHLRGQDKVTVFGILRYRTTSGGANVLSFQNRVSLVRPGPGRSAPPSYLYDLFLEAGKAGYTKHLSLAQEIGPGESDHFLIRLGTDKSAVFDLQFSFKTTDGRYLPRKDVLLEVFVPRTGAERDREPR
jgi:hypothetical protein